MDDFRLQIFSTCPPSTQSTADYPQRIAEVARWSERAGFGGLLIYTDNSLADPWLVAQIAIQATEALSPLVAVQPVYSHPYTIAKTVASLAALHKRRVYLNMVAGGFKNDLVALGDSTPHDERYERLTEYTRIIQKLLTTPGPVTFEGKFYQIKNLSLRPSIDATLQPGYFVSGSSDAGRAAARETGSVAIHYPEPADALRSDPTDDSERGIRIGIIARASEMDAWSVAFQRFPDTRKGRLTREMANRVSDSEWHHRLAQIQTAENTGPYWLAPFENYHTNCPYLVGSYEVVGAEIAKYVARAYRTIILDIPASEEEFDHLGTVLQNSGLCLPLRLRSGQGAGYEFHRN